MGSIDKSEINFRENIKGLAFTLWFYSERCSLSFMEPHGLKLMKGYDALIKKIEKLKDAA
jgi:hypothetical protein